LVAAVIADEPRPDVTLAGAVLSCMARRVDVAELPARSITVTEATMFWFAALAMLSTVAPAPVTSGR